MLKKINRIGKKKEFERIKGEGELKQTPWFGVLVTKEAEGKKFGWIISKKVSKKAVERNRIKRIMAEAVRRNLEKVPEGRRAIFLVKKAMLGKGVEEIEGELMKCLS
ncbi:ribonuclease P protein component [Candidatus Shapirobacteria bacterium RBG_13_44_7]|uniref:Ribonuclease P protein component n=1 Tax=Candidatus Shapirobacteria bacterium RBG_13_44_7 TaxID=1802149 RepID=A0A1F7SGC0_9BACT|nr:MAG: ribonuclease P protein component [Candidatus Shapirobacteria bacterium RBG_13_44_7]